MKKELCLFLLAVLLVSCTQNLPPAPGTPGVAVPVGKATAAFEGYAEPTTLSVTPEALTFAFEDLEKNIDISVSGDQYVYKTGYVLEVKSNSWKSFEFQESAIPFSKWISGKATKTLTIAKESLIDSLPDVATIKDLYVIVYACSKSLSGWSCHENKWMIKNIKTKIESVESLPPEPVLPSDLLESPVGGYSSCQDVLNEVAQIAASGDAKASGLLISNMNCVESSLNQSLAEVYSPLLSSLSSGKYVESEGNNKNSIDYHQKFFIGPSPNVVFGQDDDLAPNEGNYLFINKGDLIYGYSLGFSGGISYDYSSLQNAKDDFLQTNIQLLDKSYFFTDLTLDSNGLIDSLTLLTGKNVFWLTQNNPTVVNVFGTEHTIEVLDVPENSGVCQIKVDDITTAINVGATQLVDGLNIGIIDARIIHSPEMNQDTCLLAAGARELRLPNNGNVVANGVEIDGASVRLITTSSPVKFQGIEMRYDGTDLENDLYLGEFVEPVFGFMFNFIGKATSGKFLTLVGYILNAIDKKEYSQTTQTSTEDTIVPTTLWLTENKPIALYLGGIAHEVKVVDVTSTEEDCQVNIDGVTHWAALGETTAWNGVKFTVLDVRAIHAQLMDVDLCQLEIDKSTVIDYVSKYSGVTEYLEGKSYYFDGIYFSMSDVNEAGTACGITTNGIDRWLKETYPLAWGGLSFSVVRSYPVHSQEKNKDVCLLSIKKSDSSDSQEGRWLTEGNEATFNSFDGTHKVKLIDISNNEDKCGIEVDGETRWIGVGDSSSWNSKSITVLEVIAVNSLLQNDDVCRVEIIDSSETTPYDKNYLKQNVPLAVTVGGITHSVEVLDVTEQEDACQVKVDDVTAIIDADYPSSYASQKTINGVQIGIKEAIGVHAQLQDVDLCDIIILNPDGVKMSCKDSDVENNVYVKGTLTFSDGSKSKEDSCSIISGTTSYTFVDSCQASVDVSCATMEMSCPTAENGMTEATQTLCPKGDYCNAGVCIKAVCTDSDGGNEIYVSGFAEDNLGHKTYDECNTGTGYANECSGPNCGVDEAMCNQGVAISYSPGGKGVSCPNGCSNGACLVAS